VVGALTLRNNWDVDFALEFGNLAIATIRAIETCLTDKAPKDFPNRLDADGRQQDIIKDLDHDIGVLEGGISEAIGRSGKGEPDHSHWKAALTGAREARVKESEFIDTASFLHNRYIDYRRPLLLAMRRHRLEYLRLLQAELQPLEEGIVFKA
jgi:hypothetical protein